MLKKVVLAVQGIAAIASVAFVVLLFANEPDGAPAPSLGATVYADNCAACHGANGGGGVGPSLRGVADAIPNVADEVAVVTNGRASMPAWGGRLSPDEITAVVEYTRSGL